MHCRKKELYYKRIESGRAVISRSDNKVDFEQYQGHYPPSFLKDNPPSGGLPSAARVPLKEPKTMGGHHEKFVQ